LQPSADYRRRPVLGHPKGARRKTGKTFDSTGRLWQLASIPIPGPDERKKTPMPKEEWGTKRLCPTTGKRFYDLNKTPIVSPYTGEVVILDTGNKTRVAIPEKAKEKEEEEVVLVDDAEETLEVEDDADVELEDDILDDDDDDSVSLDEIADVPADDDDT
jgi:uncharacterized protein (TIGR02300 family)